MMPSQTCDAPSLQRGELADDSYPWSRLHHPPRCCRPRAVGGRLHHDPKPGGRQLNDNTIHAAVSTKLTGARFSNILNIDINVTNGVVTLAGEVPNAQVKAEAEQEARSVSGVVDVKNNLQVKAPRP